MKHIKLNNGLEMPMLGFGVFKVEDGNECIESVKTALELGYRSIDTASIYGNEKSVGIAIKESSIPREEIFLTTKLWNEVQREGNIEEAFSKSLEDLQVDYVDLYLIHWPVKEKFINSWLELEKIYKSGRAKAIGISNFHIHHIEEIKKIWSFVPTVNQIELHPRLTQKPILEYCNKHNIIVESWSPLGASKNNLLEDEVLKAIGKKYDKTPAQIILRWNIECGIITIPKSKTPSRIKENIDIFDFELTKDEIDTINNMNKDERVGSNPDNFNF